MGVLNKDDFMSAIQGIVGDDKSDEAIAFVENMTDTFNDLEKKSKGDGTDWKTKYEENDKQWREKYTQRFYTGVSEDDAQQEQEQEEQQKPLTFSDLFTTKG